MTKRKPQKDKPQTMAVQSTVESPAKLHKGHTLSRNLDAVAGSPKGWRNENESPLDRYAAKGLLAGGGGQITSEMRVAAGNTYRRLCELCRGSTRDSSQLTISGARSPGTISDSSADAMRLKISVDSHLSENDRTICRMACHEGYRPSEAIRKIDPRYRDATVPRFLEAMDSLIRAFEAAKRSGYEFRIG